LPIELASSKRLVIAALMHCFEPAARNGKRGMNLIRFSKTQLAESHKQHPELRHREAMARRKRRAVGLVINERDRH
jgi:hypothetical protein